MHHIYLSNSKNPTFVLPDSQPPFTFGHMCTQVRSAIVNGGRRNSLSSHSLPDSIQFRKLFNCLPCLTMCTAIFLKFYLWHIPVSLKNSSEGLNTNIYLPFLRFTLGMLTCENQDLSSSLAFIHIKAGVSGILTAN